VAVTAIRCVADDYTGATDAASALRGAGLRVALRFGPAAPGEPLPDADAVVAARRLRATTPADAVAAALDAARWLGPGPLFHKVCSTFDSTDEGNIGPVADALLDAVGADIALVCPAAPAHGRTVYMGHLFVGDRLLSESGMREHPLTPMRDPDLVRVLGRQTSHRVGLVPLPVVRAGAVAVRLAELARDGVRYAVADAVDGADLDHLARAAAPVMVGAAGLAAALGRAHGPRAGHAPAAPEPPPARAAVVLSGSCSPATLRQVEVARSHMPSHRLDPRAGGDATASAIAWLDRTSGGGPVLVYASAGADDRDPAHAGAVERAMGALARHAVANGADRLVVAGGETSGAVVDALGVSPVLVGGDAAPGVPWLLARGLALLLKSGNFGDPDLLVRAAGGG
jgi:uncharacterized protein YgbK (DUF1537 family)